MGKATVRWLNGLNFVGVDSTDHSVVISADDPSIGVRPSEMLLVALASCSAVDVVEILRKKRMPISHMEITAESEHDPDPPWTFRKIKVTYRLKGANLTPKGVAQAIELSETKYCSVAATVGGTAKIETHFEILSDED